MGSRSIATGVVVVSGLLATGCPNANTYGTARTTPKGEISHSLSAEGFGAQVETTRVDSAGQTQEEKVNVFVPLPPSYHLRWGVAEQADLGFHVYNMSSLGFDGKLNFLKGRVDLAVNPGVSGTATPTMSATARTASTSSTCTARC